MTVTIHRGTHEIGGSCVEIASGSTRIIMDIGMPLTKPPVGEKPLRPDVPGLYPDSPGDSPDAVFVSHPHLDHYGFLMEIRPEIPVYIGKGASRLVRLTGIFTRRPFEIKNIFFLTSGKPVQVGSLTFTPWLMDHSAFDAYAFVVTDGVKTLVYTGDFRDHGRKGNLLDVFLENVPHSPDLLLMEGTVLPGGDTGNPSHSSFTERDVEGKLKKLFSQSKKTILFMSSGQNIDRLVSLYKAALSSKRVMAVDVYVANVLNEIYPGTRLPHPSRNFRSLRVFFPHKVTNLLKRNGLSNLINQFYSFEVTWEEMAKNPSKYIILVRTSHLEELRSMDFLEEADFVYSQWSGYLEEPSMWSMKNFIFEKKMKFHIIHSGGHAFPQTLKKTVNTIQPKLLVPIHTQNPDAYRDYFDCPVRVLSDGERFEFLSCENP